PSQPRFRSLATAPAVAPLVTAPDVAPPAEKPADAPPAGAAGRTLQPPAASSRALSACPADAEASRRSMLRRTLSTICLTSASVSRISNTDHLFRPVVRARSGRFRPRSSGQPPEHFLRVLRNNLLNDGLFLRFRPRSVLAAGVFPRCVRARRVHPPSVRSRGIR